MTMVRCILVETTVPFRIRPRIETRPVKGHFLSVKRAPPRNVSFLVLLSPHHPGVSHPSKSHSILVNWFLESPGLFPPLPIRLSSWTPPPPARKQLQRKPSVFTPFSSSFSRSRTDVLALDGSLGSPEAQSNILVVTATSLARPR